LQSPPFQATKRGENRAERAPKLDSLQHLPKDCLQKNSKIYRRRFREFASLAFRLAATL
jgi:hypothetical protein